MKKLIGVSAICCAVAIVVVLTMNKKGPPRNNKPQEQLQVTTYSLSPQKVDDVISGNVCANISDHLPIFMVQNNEAILPNSNRDQSIPRNGECATYIPFT